MNEPIRLTSRPLAEVEARRLVVALFEDEPPGTADAEPLGLLGRLAAAKDVGTGVGDVTPVHGTAGLRAGSLLALGLGRREAFRPGPAYNAGVTLAKKLAGKKREAVAVSLPAGVPPASVSELACGLVVGQQGPDLRKSEGGRLPFERLELVIPEGEAGALESAVRRGEILGSAVNLARELVNLPPTEKPPARLAERMRDEARGEGVEVEVWDGSRIERERFGGLSAVGAGSDQPPAFVVLRYAGAGEGEPVTALVGKGVTFDSGGLSLKPTASMEDMKADMTGAAVVLATIRAAAQLGLRRNLMGYLPLAENMTGGRAMKLGDVLTMRNGKTVEVLNTDAEGRLILADALSYAAEAKPARIVDLATLTGACMVALGTKVAGLFCNDEELAVSLQVGCARTGERVWRLPLDEDYDEALKSAVADLKNVGGKWGGAITAAKFLQRFVGAMPWAHLDVAGPSWADSENSTRDAGGTGCFVRTLVGWLEGPGSVGV